MDSALAAAAATALSAAALGAQQSWIVDPNGTGQFTSLAPAIAASNPGDLILLRGGGSYSAVHLVDKPLQIIGEGPTRSSVQSLVQSGQTVMGTSSYRGFDVQEIRLEQPTTMADLRVRAIAVTNGAVLAAHDCDVGSSWSTTPWFGPALVVVAGTATLNDCRVRGNLPTLANPLFCTHWPSPGLAVQPSSTLTLSDCVVEGGPDTTVFCSSPPAPPGVGIVANGTVRVTRSDIRGGARQNGVRVAAVSVGPTGVVLHDASATFDPPSFQPTLEFLPGTVASDALPGQTIFASAVSQPGLPAALIAGLGLRAPTPTGLGEAWVAPNAFVVLAIGLTDGTGKLDSSVVLPPTSPRGLPITFQGLAAPSLNAPPALGVPAIVHVL